MVTHTTCYRTNEVAELEGYATLAYPDDEEKPAVMILKYDYEPDSMPGAHYNIWDTDYENYAVVFACNPVNQAETNGLWIQTREQQPAPELLQQVYDRMTEFGFDTVSLLRDVQTDACPAV